LNRPLLGRDRGLPYDEEGLEFGGEERGDMMGVVGADADGVV
jgi:hypothetical protein